MRRAWSVLEERVAVKHQHIYGISIDVFDVCDKRQNLGGRGENVRETE
jgi:hypothetical protein